MQHTQSTAVSQNTHKNAQKYKKSPKNSVNNLNTKTTFTSSVRPPQFKKSRIHMAKATEPLTFRVDLEVHSDLSKKAQIHGVKKSELARQYILEGLHASQRLAEFQRKLEEVSERMLIVTQELQRLRQQEGLTQRWIDLSNALLISRADGKTFDQAMQEWNTIKAKL
jgi:hypothetical protein